MKYDHKIILKNGDEAWLRNGDASDGDAVYEIFNLTHEKASLAVQKSNYAVRLYEKVGFRKVNENSEEFIMVCDLGGLACCQACSLIRSKRI